MVIKSDVSRFMIEGDYVRDFFETLKTMVPKDQREFFPEKRYWMFDKLFFTRIFELAYEHFFKIILVEDTREDIYLTGKFETERKCRIRYMNDAAYIDILHRKIDFKSDFMGWVYYFVPKDRWTVSGQGDDERIWVMATHKQAYAIESIAQLQDAAFEDKNPERWRMVGGWHEVVDLRDQKVSLAPSPPGRFVHDFDFPLKITLPDIRPFQLPGTKPKRQMCRVVYRGESIFLTYEPGDAIFSCWMEKAVNLNRFWPTGCGVELGCEVTRDEVDFIKRVVWQPWPGLAEGWTIEETFDCNEPEPVEVSVVMRLRGGEWLWLIAG
jgi:hypothetical protein